MNETKGLSDSQKDELLKQLNDFAQSKKGEVIIYDLTQAVQLFLHKHNKPPVGSFYDQMLKEKIKRVEVLNKENAQKLSKEQQVLREEVIKRQEILRNEGRYRREKRSSMSESSPTHRTHSISTEIIDVTQGMFLEKDVCEMHMNSEDLYFSTVGRKIRRGCCLGEYKNTYTRLNIISFLMVKFLFQVIPKMVVSCTLVWIQITVNCSTSPNGPSNIHNSNLSAH